MLICSSHVRLFATLWTIAHQALSVHGFPSKNTRVGCHALLQGISPTQGLNPHLSGLLHWQVCSLPLVAPGKSSFLCSVQFSRSVMSDSLRPHKSQHARPPCPSPTPRVHSDSGLSSQWYHPAISSSVVPFSSCPSPSQHQGLFQCVNSSHEVAKVLEFQL